MRERLTPHFEAHEVPMRKLLPLIVYASLEACASHVPPPLDPPTWSQPETPTWSQPETPSPASDVRCPNPYGQGRDSSFVACSRAGPTQ
jgi:hypothetical protein